MSTAGSQGQAWLKLQGLLVLIVLSALQAAESLQISASPQYRTCVCAYGVMKCWGFEETAADAPPINLGAARCQQVTSGAGFTCVLLNTGDVKCLGANGFGQLGKGDSIDSTEDPTQMGDSFASVDLGGQAVQISSGAFHTCARLKNGGVKCWGLNDQGQLGLGDPLSRGDDASEMGTNLPVVELGTSRTAKAVVAGSSHTCAILDDDSLKCWGANHAGQLGTTDSLPRGDQAYQMGDTLPPIDLGYGRTSASVALGADHTCAALDNGDVKCWGENSDGRLGIGSTDAVVAMGDALPAVSLGGAVTQVSAWDATTCALLTTGQAKCWGDNSVGQLGIGDIQLRGDRIEDMGEALPTVDLGFGTQVSQLAVGLQYVCAAISDTLVKCWGAGAWLGLSDGFDNKGDGPNEMGDILLAPELGIVVPQPSPPPDPPSPPSSPSPPPSPPRPPPPTTLPVPDGIQVSASYNHTCVVGGGALKCWGDNSNGQLGLGNADAMQPSPDVPRVDLGTGAVVVQVCTGLDFTCGLLNSGQVKCFGLNSDGQLGQGNQMTWGDGPNEMGDSLQAVPLGGVKSTMIACGAAHACALLDTKQVKCWGRNINGQLGQGDMNNRGDQAGEMGENLPPVDLGTGRTASAVFAGQEHTCVMLMDPHDVKCWGANAAGQLGQGNTDTVGDASDEMGDNLAIVDLGVDDAGAPLTAVTMALGYDHTCVIIDVPNQVKCWGGNSRGELGFGDTDNRGDQVGEMGAALLVVDLSYAMALSITTRTYTTCVKLAGDPDKQVKCWGANGNGQLGLGDAIDRQSPDAQAVNLGPGVSQLDAGDGHVCVTIGSSTSSSVVKCWGKGERLGLPATATLGDNPDEVSPSLAAVNFGTLDISAGTPPSSGGILPIPQVLMVAVSVGHSCSWGFGALKCWGNNTHGQLGIGRSSQMEGSTPESLRSLATVDLGTGRAAVQVAVGADFTCVLLDSGDVKCWGANNKGQLGQDDTTTRGTGTGQMGDELPTVPLGSARTAVQIAAGAGHVCAVLDNNWLKCWGDNSHGQLGYDNSENVGDGVGGAMGDALLPVALGDARTASAVYLGDSHTCVVLDGDIDVKCWGANAHGQLGLGSTNDVGLVPGDMASLTPLDLGGAPVGSMSLGTSHSCVVLEGGVLKCWGGNSRGQLGDGTTADHLAPTQPEVNVGGRGTSFVAAGDTFTCASLWDGKAKCWGENYKGALGSGDGNGTLTGVPNETLRDVDLGVSSEWTITQLAASPTHACAVLTDTQLKCWGLSSLVAAGPGRFVGLDAGTMGSALPWIDLGAPLVTLPDPAPPPPPPTPPLPPGLILQPPLPSSPPPSPPAPIASPVPQASPSPVPSPTPSQPPPAILLISERASSAATHAERLRMAIGVGLGAVTVLVLAGLLLFCCHRRRHNKKVAAMEAEAKKLQSSHPPGSSSSIAGPWAKGGHAGLRTSLPDADMPWSSTTALPPGSPPRVSMLGDENVAPVRTKPKAPEPDPRGWMILASAVKVKRHHRRHDPMEDSPPGTPPSGTQAFRPPASILHPTLPTAPKPAVTLVSSNPPQWQITQGSLAAQFDPPRTARRASTASNGSGLGPPNSMSHQQDGDLANSTLSGHHARPVHTPAPLHVASGPGYDVLAGEDWPEGRQPQSGSRSSTPARAFSPSGPGSPRGSVGGYSAGRPPQTASGLIGPAGDFSEYAPHGANGKLSHTSSAMFPAGDAGGYAVAAASNAGKLSHSSSAMFPTGEQSGFAVAPTSAKLPRSSSAMYGSGDVGIHGLPGPGSPMHVYGDYAGGARPVTTGTAALRATGDLAAGYAGVAQPMTTGAAALRTSGDLTAGHPGSGHASAHTSWQAEAPAVESPTARARRGSTASSAAAASEQLVIEDAAKSKSRRASIAGSTGAASGRYGSVGADPLADEPPPVGEQSWVDLKDTNRMQLGGSNDQSGDDEDFPPRPAPKGVIRVSTIHGLDDAPLQNYADDGDWRHSGRYGAAAAAATAPAPPMPPRRPTREDYDNDNDDDEEDEDNDNDSVESGGSFRPAFAALSKPDGARGSASVYAPAPFPYRPAGGNAPATSIYAPAATPYSPVVPAGSYWSPPPAHASGASLPIPHPGPASTEDSLFRSMLNNAPPAAAAGHRPHGLHNALGYNPTQGAAPAMPVVPAVQPHVAPAASRAARVLQGNIGPKSPYGV